MVLYSQEAGELDEPAHVVWVDAVVDGPAAQFVPLVTGAPVDGETQLRVLVLALLQVIHDLLEQDRDTMERRAKNVKKSSCHKRGSIRLGVSVANLDTNNMAASSL